MRILISSHRFTPDVGGIETATTLLAEEWRRAGHEVTIVTETPGPAMAGVWRKPRPRELWNLVRACDVFFHNNLSLRMAWPLLAIRRPWFVTSQVWVVDLAGNTGRSEKLKRLALQHARNFFISRAVARHVGLPGEVLPNPYNAAVFRRRAEVDRDRDLIFVGRLVSDKGVDLLVSALASLKDPNAPRLTIVGAGPEESGLRRQVDELGLAGRVTFAGVRQGDELARLLNAHRVLVVPSRWAEPFGIVALEGLACGCRVVASRDGGLGEAVGGVGATFANGDVAGLAAALTSELAASGTTDPEWDARVARHLATFAAPRIAATYLARFRAVVESGGER